MLNTFYKTDPSSVYSKVAESPKISRIMQEMSVETLDEDLSFVAKASEKDKTVFGAAINGTRPTTVKPNFKDGIMKQIQSKREKTLLELWEFISAMPPDSKKFFGNEENVFEVRYLVVEPAHRNKGIATALVNQSRKEAAARGHKFIRIDCTSHFTARIASAMGLNCIYEIDYQDYKNPSGEHVFKDVVYPHTKVLVYAGKAQPGSQ